MTTGRGLRVGEAVLGGGVLALGLLVAVQTTQLKGAATGVVGPTLFPYLVAAGLVVIGAVLLGEAVRGRIAHEGGLALDWVAFALVAAGLIAEMLLLERAGWIPSAALLFAAVARAFGSRRLLLDLVLGLALAALAFVVFDLGLDLSLPTGLPGELLAPAEPDPS